MPTNEVLREEFNDESTTHITYHIRRALDSENLFRKKNNLLARITKYSNTTAKQ